MYPNQRSFAWSRPCAPSWLPRLTRAAFPPHSCLRFFGMILVLSECVTGLRWRRSARHHHLHASLPICFDEIDPTGLRWMLQGTLGQAGGTPDHKDHGLQLSPCKTCGVLPASPISGPKAQQLLRKATDNNIFIYSIESVLEKAFPRCWGSLHRFRHVGAPSRKLSRPRSLGTNRLYQDQSHDSRGTVHMNLHPPFTILTATRRLHPAWPASWVGTKWVGTKRAGTK